MYTLLVSCCLILAVSGAVVPGPAEKLQQERKIQEDVQKTRIQPDPSLNIINEQNTPRPHVAILKHVNRINSDGSYTYGYQGADGSFKIETRFATGEVKGKYGYIDADGNTKEITYGAAPGRGFEPVVPGVEVPPPVIKAQTPDYDYEYYDNYVQTEAPAPVVQRKPARRRPSRVKVNRRLRPQPPRKQVAAPVDHVDVQKVVSKTRPQIKAPGASQARPQAQPAPQKQQQFTPVQQPARAQQQQFVQQPARQQQQQFAQQTSSYSIPGSHSVSISLPTFSAIQQQFQAPQQQFAPQPAPQPRPAPVEVNRAPARGSPVLLPPGVQAPVHGPRQHIPVLTAQQVHPALSSLDLNTGSYSLKVGGRR